MNSSHSEELNFNDYAQTVGYGAKNTRSHTDWVPSSNDNHYANDLLTDTLNFTRVKLTSFRLLRNVNEITSRFEHYIICGDIV